MAVRAAALRDLTNRNEASAWAVLLRARLSRFPDVVSGVDSVVRRQVREPAFQLFLQERACSPQGVISDLAMDVLQLHGKVRPADAENYRNVVRQRLDLLRSWNERFSKDFEEVRNRLTPPPGQPTSPLSASSGPKGLLCEIETLRKNIEKATPKEQTHVGVRASVLLERIGLLLPVVADLQRQSASLQQGSDLKNFVDRRLVELLTLSGLITPAVEDKATLQIIQTITQWPHDLAQVVTMQIQKQFTEARASIQRAYDYVKPLPSFKNAWADFRSQILSPLLQETDQSLKRVGEIQIRAQRDAQGALVDIRSLTPQLDDLGVRIEAALAATDVEETYTGFAIANETAKDLARDTEQGLKTLFFLFEDLSDKRWYPADKPSLPTAQRRQMFDDLVTSQPVAQIKASVERWYEIHDGDMRFARLLGEGGILLMSASTGLLAGGIVEGLLGRGISLGGRFLIATAVVGVESSVFTLTSRALHAVVFGEAFYDKTLWKEWAHNAALFGLLKGAGAVYEAFVARLLPKPLVGIGKATQLFVVFQAWTVGVHRWQTREWLTPANPRFWKLAAKNVAFLAAVHLGMTITKPLLLPLQSKVAAFALSRHNARCAALGESIQQWQATGGGDLDGALDIVLRARTLFLERIEVLKQINAIQKSLLGDGEWKEAGKFLNAQVAALQESLFDLRFKLAPHETAPRLFYYEGDVQALRQHYEQQGFKVLEVDAATGRLRLADSKGEIWDFIRSRSSPSGAGFLETDVDVQKLAEKMYETIRNTQGDTAKIARNTGIPKKALDLIRQHVFLWKHWMFDPVAGEMKYRRFTAHAQIARLWGAATEGTLEGEDLLRFRRLMAHEYVEAKLMAQGIPYQHRGSWKYTKSGVWDYTPSPKNGLGAHELAPLAGVDRPAFEHYEKWARPLSDIQKLPLEKWMGIPPEDMK